MAKENGSKKQDASAAYFTSLTIENIRCFKGEHTVNLLGGEGQPAQWTVILGNNNTGKTTLLKCWAGLDTLKKPIVSGQDMTIEGFYGIKERWPIENFEEMGKFRISADIVLSRNIHSNINGTKKYSVSYYRLNESMEDDIDDYALFVSISLFNPTVKPLVYSYGASRKISKKSLSEPETANLHGSLFENEELTNVEDWLLNLFIAEKLGKSEAENTLNLALKVLISGILPDVREVRLRSQEKGAGFENFVEFLTDYGWIRLRDLGYGYQTMIAWVLDLVKRMVERYPNSENPLAEPAIVLVDEIDLHLHPDWQRRIIAHLTKYFPNTQFIVTAHSPLVVQSADEVNLVILKKTADHVTIEQPKIRSFKGWTVEEILTDLMDLEGQTMSNTYLELMQQFDEALDEDNYEKAKDAYDQLDKILHPGSSQRKLMKIQMTSLSPAEAV